MQKKRSRRSTSYILCIVLVTVMAWMATGCNGNTKDQSSTVRTQSDTENETLNTQTESDTETETTDTKTEDDTQGHTSGTWPDGSVIGEGSKEFTFTVVDQDGSEAKLEIHTDQETVGAALSELGLIDGDEGEYGLYVKTVNGITADYDKDGVYWAFYINDEYSQTGVDTTAVTEGDSYSFKIEKG